MALVVQKYGGTSVANAERIRNVAGRIARKRAEGNDVVAVVSAMGDTTDELIALARQITDHPEPREMDVLLSTGETVSSALLVMALHALGVEAISLSGAQAGMRTSSVHRNARILAIEPRRAARGAGPRPRRHRRRLPGPDGGRGRRDDRPRRLRHDRCRLRRRRSMPTCEIYTDVEGVYTADPRVVPRRAQARRHQLRGDAGVRQQGAPR